MSHDATKMTHEEIRRLCGWIPPIQRTKVQHAAHCKALASGLPAFSLQGTYHEVKGRFALWRALQMVLKPADPQVLPYNYQVTGSCVGAGGDNMLKTKQAVEIMFGDLEEWKITWWPYTYGKSRLRMGDRSPGEGSLGSTWAEAITLDGSFAVEEKPGLPAFRDVDGWLQLEERTELSWSDGDAPQSMECEALGKQHLVRAYVQIKNADEGKAAIVNGYPLTQASGFGTRTIRPVGTPAVNIGLYDGNWNHQTYIDEVWDHPTEGLIFRWGNNWGKKAHPAPTQGEPWGGFYITAKTFDQICSEREMFAFSGDYNGFKVRKIDWFI